MKQIWYLKIYSPSGLASKLISFETLYLLVNYINKHDNLGYEKYEITKGVGYVKN